MIPLAALVIAALATPPLFARFERQVGGFSEPRGVAVTREGTIVVADTGRHRIVWVERASGAILRAVGARGAAPGEFLFPSGVAVAPSGEIVVADTGNHRLQILAADGRSPRVVGGEGVDPGRFHTPEGVAASADRIAVADTGNARAQVLRASDGAPLFSATAFARPAAVALLGDGALAVADADLHRVQVFDATGAARAAFGGLGPHRGLLAEPKGLAFHAGALYVADTRNHRVQAFAPDGSPLGAWGVHAFEPREGDGKLHYPDAIAIAPDGAFAVVAESIEDRIQVFTVDAAAPAPVSAAGGAVTHFGRAIAADAGLIALVEPERDAIVLYDARGTEPILVTSLGAPGLGPGRLTRPLGLALFDDGRRLAVADAGAALVQLFGLERDGAAPLRFDPRMARFVKSAALGAVRPDDPRPVAVERDAAGRLHCLDARNGRVLVLGPDLRRGGEYGRGLAGASDLALDATGRVAYVVESLAGRVRAIDTETGAEIRTLGSPGVGDGEFARPFGVAVGRDGAVHVTDSLAHRVLEFDASGRFVRAFGGAGLRAGEFFKPAGIARDERGRLLVVDHGNHRVQTFSPSDGRFESAFGARSYVRPTRAKEERE